MSFSETTPNEEGSADQVSSDQAADQQIQSQPPKVETPTIVVGDKTYSLEEAQKKLAHQDQFIETLKGERKEDSDNAETILSRLKHLEESTTTREGLEALLANLSKAPEQKEPSENAPSVPSTEEITESVRAQLKAEELQEKQQGNMDAALGAAKEAYGDEFGKKILELGREAGYSPEGVDDLAKNHPKAFEKLFLPEGALTPPTDTTRSTVGSVGLRPQEAPKQPSFTKVRSSSERSRMVAERIRQKEEQAAK